jgi:hypothetical protein
MWPVELDLCRRPGPGRRGLVEVGQPVVCRRHDAAGDGAACDHAQFEQATGDGSPEWTGEVVGRFGHPRSILEHIKRMITRENIRVAEGRRLWELE